MVPSPALQRLSDHQKFFIAMCPCVVVLIEILVNLTLSSAVKPVKHFPIQPSKRACFIIASRFQLIKLKRYQRSQKFKVSQKVSCSFRSLLKRSNTTGNYGDNRGTTNVYRSNKEKGKLSNCSYSHFCCCESIKHIITTSSDVVSFKVPLLQFIDVYLVVLIGIQMSCCLSSVSGLWLCCHVLKHI